jgi:hypothetical protein
MHFFLEGLIGLSFWNIFRFNFMAVNPVVGFYLPPRRLNKRTMFLGDWTPGMKATARRRIDGTGNIPF